MVQVVEVKVELLKADLNLIQVVRNLQEVLQEVEVKVELLKEDLKVLQEVRNHQEVLRVEEHLKAEQVKAVQRHQEKLLRQVRVGQEDQKQGAILGVSLISQYLQIRI